MRKSFGYINRCLKKNVHRTKKLCTLRAFRKPSFIPEVILALSYKQIYDDFAKVNPKDLIKGIPTFVVLSEILKLECDVHYTLHNPDEDHKHISDYYNICDTQERDKSKSAMKKHGRNLLLINTEGTLRFVRLALTCYVPEVKGYKLTASDRKNIYKAYLFCNQIWTNEQLNNNVFAFSNFVDASLRIDLPFSEFKYFKDFRTQMYKSIHFFQFAERNEILKIILDNIAVR